MFDVFTVVRLRIPAEDQNEAENKALDILDGLDFPQDVELGIELSPKNPVSVKVVTSTMPAERALPIEQWPLAEDYGCPIMLAGQWERSNDSTIDRKA